MAQIGLFGKVECPKANGGIDMLTIGRLIRNVLDPDMNVIGAIVRQHSALFRVMVSFSASLGARDVSRGNSFQRQTVADALVDDGPRFDH